MQGPISLCTAPTFGWPYKEAWFRYESAGTPYERKHYRTCGCHSYQYGWQRCVVPVRSNQETQICAPRLLPQLRPSLRESCLGARQVGKAVWHDVRSCSWLQQSESSSAPKHKPCWSKLLSIPPNYRGWSEILIKALEYCVWATTPTYAQQYCKELFCPQNH